MLMRVSVRGTSSTGYSWPGQQANDWIPASAWVTVRLLGLPPCMPYLRSPAASRSCILIYMSLLKATGLSIT